MKNALVLLLSLSIVSVFSQTNEKDSLSLFVKDTNIVKERYVGFNIATLIRQIEDPNLSVKNYSLIYKVKKSNNITYQLKINVYSKNDKETYAFTDSSDNPVERTYKEEYGKIDLRAGVGLYDKLGFGNIYINTNLIIGYAQLTKKYDDFTVFVNDTIVEGYESQGFQVSEADYFCVGLDFAFGYEIDLGKHLMLSMEYVPEFNFYTITREKYYIEDSPKYNNNFISANFNMFSVNLLYHF